MDDNDIFTRPLPELSEGELRKAVEVLRERLRVSRLETQEVQDKVAEINNYLMPVECYLGDAHGGEALDDAREGFRKTKETLKTLGEELNRFCP